MQVKILGIADVHCSYQYSSYIIYEIIKHRVDLVLIAGDIECEDPLDKIIDSGVDVFAVTGNMDDTYIYRIMKDYGIAIDGMIREYRGFTIAGIGGLSFRTNFEKIINILNETSGLERLIILSHYPPKGFNDTTYAGVHAGLNQLRDLVEKYSPMLFIHGHIHEARGVSKYNNTIIVNPGPLMHGYYSIIEISHNNVNVHLHRL